jgi:hypothetical protein
MNLKSRLRKLESARRIDASGFAPRSEAWFTYWEDIFDRSIAGEDVECAGFPLEVIDRMVAAFDAEARMARP